MNIYINNIQIFDFKKNKNILNLKKKLNKKFVITNFGPFIYYLNIILYRIKIQKNRIKKTIKIIQIIYLKKIIARFEIINYIVIFKLIIIESQLQKKQID